MTREELLLNDFDGFERFLFTEEEHLLSEDIRWKKYYFTEDGDDLRIFHPPIDQPKTLVEYQLDHYALWMVIYVFELGRKPTFHGYKPFAVCYACALAINNSCCPIKKWKKTDKNDSVSYCVHGTYGKWERTLDNSLAYEIAHYEWEEDYSVEEEFEAE